MADENNVPSEQSETVDYEAMTRAALASQDRTAQSIEKLFAVAEPGAIFTPPVESGEHTLITASEVFVGMGVGFGMGGGAGDENDGGAGGGGGGGGSSFGRPVAVISIGPNGVDVEPVVDVTKIAIAFVTALGAIFLSLRRMRRMSRQLEDEIQP